MVLDEQRQMARLVLKGWTIDFARLEGEDLTEDLFRRDFRLNAIALSLSPPQQLIDPTGGLQDLQDGLICAIRESNLRDDPLRLLRALRLMAELEMRIDTDTLAMVKANSALLTRSAPERIQAELLRLVAAPAADAAITLLQSLDLLKPWSAPDWKHSHVNASQRLRAASSMTLEEQSLALPLARLTALLSDSGLRSLRFSDDRFNVAPSCANGRSAALMGTAAAWMRWKGCACTKTLRLIFQPWFCAGQSSTETDGCSDGGTRRTRCSIPVPPWMGTPSRASSLSIRAQYSVP